MVACVTLNMILAFNDFVFIKKWTQSFFILYLLIIFSEKVYFKLHTLDMLAELF